MGIYFSDFFDVSPDVLDDYGAFDVSLINDLPLFVDPFLLFNSSDAQYRDLHDQIIKYMRFLKDVSTSGALDDGLLTLWFTFPEVSQNWMGFSREGNRGHGLGMLFARALHRNLRTVFRDFGEETVTRSSHLEKLCLIRDGVGRDNISDFTTNLIKGFLAEYTEAFAKQHVDRSLRRRVPVTKAAFDYHTSTWATRHFELPFTNGDYVLLTPKDILTKDESWINRPELLDRFRDIADALPDPVLRSAVDNYLRRVLPKAPDAGRDEIHDAISRVIERYPAVLDYYIRAKEEEGPRARSLARARVREVESRFVERVRELVEDFLRPGGFYAIGRDTYEDARRRLLFLKDVIENKGGHRIFYVNGVPIEREQDLHILYRLTWFASSSDVSREVDDGRGPADFKISRGAPDKTIVEFKLAKNTHLERNLARQAEIYEKASDATHPSLKAILYFDDGQLERVTAILKRLNLSKSPHIMLIDGRSDNKPSASRA